MSLLPIKSSALASHLRVKANMHAIAHKALHLFSYPPLVHFIPSKLASLLSFTTAGTTFSHFIFSAQNIFPQDLYMIYSLISLKSLLKCFCLSEKFLIILFKTMKLSVTQHLLSLPCFNFPLQPSTLSRHRIHFLYCSSLHYWMEVLLGRDVCSRLYPQCLIMCLAQSRLSVNISE